jgi:hypothetical protein
MPRNYVVSFENVAVAAAQDLLQVKGAAGKTLRILSQRCKLYDNTLPAAQSLAFRGRFLPATVTDGSGGSTPTPRQTDPGDAAASFTALANNTVKATTSGTALTLTEGGEHIYNGYEKIFAAGRQPVVGPSESYVFELLTAPQASTHLSGEVEVEESGG